MIRYLAMDIGCLHCEDGVNLSRVLGLFDTQTEAELVCSIEANKVSLAGLNEPEQRWIHHAFRVFEFDDGR